MRIGLHRTFPRGDDHLGGATDADISQSLPIYKEMGVDEIDILMSETDANVGGRELRATVTEAAATGVPVKAVSPRWGWTMRAQSNPSEVDRMLSFVEAAPELGTERVMLSCSFVNPQSEDERRAHFDQVIDIYRTIAGAAEAAQIDLCTHTSSHKAGIMFGTVEGIDAFLEGVDSKRNKLLLCCGCLSVAGWDVPALIRHWGDAIGAVHLFNPCGNREHYDETRFDLGQLNLSEVLRTLGGVGYEGVLIPHEYPTFSGVCGKAISDGWVVGYLRGMLQSVNQP